MERPLFLPVAMLVAGLSIAGCYGIFLPETLLLSLVVVSFVTIFTTPRIPFLIAISLLFLCWGNLSAKPVINPHFPPNHITNFVVDNPQIFEGVIDSRPEVTEQGSRIYLQMERLLDGTRYTEVSGRILLQIGEGRVTFLTGDRVRFIARLHKPRNLGLPGEFMYGRYLACKRIYVTAFVKGADDLVLIREGVRYRTQRQIDRLAADMGRFIGAAVPEVEGSVLRALLLGERGYVPVRLEEAYTRTGVNHILSISGFHVGIIALFVFHLLLAVCRSSEFLTLNLNPRKSILLVTLPVIVFYLSLSGTAPATTRSVVMIAAYVVALLLGREIEPINSLLLAAMFILGVTPEAIFAVSFQLSFLALWGILVLTPIFSAPFSGIKSVLLRNLVLFFMASLSATVVTIFPVAYYFHRVSFTGLISNFVVVPLMGYGAVVVGFSALPFISVAPFFARLLLSVAAFLVKISDNFIVFLAGIPSLPLLNPAPLDLLLFYLLLMVLTIVPVNRHRHALCGCLAVVLLVHMTLLSEPQPRGLRMTFFSVGQGESTLITFSDGKRMLIDGGGSARQGGANVGERLLAPALWSMGVKKIDYMVLTHIHPDHLQGLLYIADNFRVGEFWRSRVSQDSDDFAKLMGILASRRIPVRLVDAATAPVTIARARFEFMSPSDGRIAGEDGAKLDANDDSLVFRLSYGRGEALFTGDIGFEAEQRLLDSKRRLSCDLLKVAHHGSRFSTSAAFLDAASPEIALISAGYGNSFHLPASETLSQLRERGVTVYRTDLDGTISVDYDPERGLFVVTKPDWHFN